MGKVDDVYERLLFGMAKRLTGRGLTVIVVALYGGLGLALPLSLGWSVPWLVGANILGASLSGTLILVWIVLLVQARDRRHLVEWTTDMRLLDRLNSNGWSANCFVAMDGKSKRPGGRTAQMAASIWP